jgi:DNA-binding MarR family transcriptional regulator
MLTKPSITEEERDAMALACTALDAFRAVNPVMTLQLAFSFLLVARDEGLGVTEYAAKAGIPQSVMSRHIADLGEYNRRHEAGLNLIVQKIDVMDRRRTLVYLSPKGRAVAAQIHRALAGTTGRKV